MVSVRYFLMALSDLIEKGEDLQGPKEFLPLSKLEGKVSMALLPCFSY
jgi:hypothetical protein